MCFVNEFKYIFQWLFFWVIKILKEFVIFFCSFRIKVGDDDAEEEVREDEEEREDLIIFFIYFGKTK